MDSKLKKNLTMQTLYQLLQVIVPLVVTPYISRVLGANNIGIYSYTYSIAYYFVIFAMLGLNNYGSRTIAFSNSNIKKRSVTFFEIYSLQLISSFIMIIIYCIYLLFNKNYQIISIIQLIYVSSAMFDISWFYFGIEEISPTIVKNTIIKLLSLIGIFIFVKDSNDLTIYTILLSCGYLFGNISLLFSLKNRVIFIKPKMKYVLKHIVPNLLLFIPVIAVSLYKTMDKIMLGILSSQNQVGFYTNAENLINVSIGFIIALGNVMLPRISRLKADGESDECKKIFLKSMSITAFLNSSLSFGIASIAPIFVPIYYGDGYSDCILLLEGQCLVAFFISWANIVRTQYLLPNRKEKIYIVSILSGALCNIVLNFILIPQYKAIGALIATIITEMIVCLIQSIYSNSYVNMVKCIKENIPFIISGFVMFVIIRCVIGLFNVSIISLVLLILTGALAYFCTLSILSYIIKKDIVYYIKYLKKY